MRNQIPLLELKKINMSEGEISKTIYLTKRFNSIPSINILGNTNQNVFIQEIDNEKFNLKRSDDTYSITVYVTICEII